MTDTLKDAAAQVILTALHAAEQTGAWLKGQIPDVLHQLLMWHMARDVVTIAIGLSPVIATIFLNKKAWPKYFAEQAEWCVKNPSKPSCYWSPSGSSYAMNTAAILTAVASVFGLMAVIGSGYDLLEILIAPKVWILEYARALIH